jgi:hypothetical protein
LARPAEESRAADAKFKAIRAATLQKGGKHPQRHHAKRLDCI